MRWFDGESIETEIVRTADRSRESQISRARSRLKPTDVSTALQMQGQSAETILFGKDDRTFEDFQQQVEKWHPRWLRGAPRHWLDRYLLAGHGVYALRLDNLTDQNFADVEVRLQIEGVAVEDEIPSEASALPEKPRPFGRGVGLADITRLSAAQMPLSVGLPTSFESPDIYAIQRDDAIEIVWEVGHMRPEATARSDEIGVVVNAPQDSDRLAIAWSATSTSVSGVIKGTAETRLSDQPVLLDDIEHDLGI